MEMRSVIIQISSLLLVLLTTSPTWACEVGPVGLGTTETDLVVGGVVTETTPLELPRDDGDMDGVVEAVRTTIVIDRTFRRHGAPRTLTFDVVSRGCTYQRVGHLGDRVAFFLKREDSAWRLQFTAWEDEVPGWLQRMRPPQRKAH
jgi:hypothetical protein